MRLSHLLQHVAIRSLTGSADAVVRAVHHDSRAVGPQDLFVAIPGARADGRRFVPGLTCAAVIAEGPVDAQPGVAVVLVDDARLALAQCAAALAGHPAASMPVVAITGTNGKTTTTWLVEALVSAAGWKAGVIGTNGHRVAGTPLPAVHTTPEAPVVQSILGRARAAGCKVVAMEASSIGLALRRVDAIPFRVAVFTSFSRDHLDFHGDMDRYRAAKARLFHELLSPAGTAVLNGDDPAHLVMVPANRRTWTYGRTPAADLQIDDVALSLSGASARLRTPMGVGQLRTGLVGDYNLENAVAAVGVGLALGLDLPTCLRGLAGLQCIPGRLERVDGPRGRMGFVDYAHTPDALTQVLSTLRPLTSGRIITVFGCGGDRDAGKRPLMGAAASAGSDHVIITSDNPRSEPPARILAEILAGVSGPHDVCEDRADAIALAVGLARPGDLVLLAGKGHETTQTIGDRVLPFDDRSVLRAAFVQELE